jgi:hypothetical protein
MSVTLRDVWGCKLTASAATFTCGSSTSTVVDCATNICAADFENVISDETHSIVLPYLNDTNGRVPYLGPYTYVTITNRTQFAWWYAVRFTQIHVVNRFLGPYGL